MLQGHQGGKSLASKGHSLRQQNGLHPHAPQSFQILLLLPLPTSQQEHFSDTQVQFFF